MRAMSKTEPFGNIPWGTSIRFVPLTQDSESQEQPLAGGEYRDRTGDLLVANQALSQLS